MVPRVLIVSGMLMVPRVLIVSGMLMVPQVMIVSGMLMVPRVLIVSGMLLVSGVLVVSRLLLVSRVLMVLLSVPGWGVGVTVSASPYFSAYIVLSKSVSREGDLVSRFAVCGVPTCDAVFARTKLSWVACSRAACSASSVLTGVCAALTAWLGSAVSLGAAAPGLWDGLADDFLAATLIVGIARGPTVPGSCFTVMGCDGAGLGWATATCNWCGAGSGHPSACGSCEAALGAVVVAVSFRARFASLRWNFAAFRSIFLSRFLSCLASSGVISGWTGTCFCCSGMAAGATAGTPCSVGVLVRRILSTGVTGEKMGTLLTRARVRLGGTAGGEGLAMFARACSCWACWYPKSAFSLAAASVPGTVLPELDAPVGRSRWLHDCQLSMI